MALAARPTPKRSPGSRPRSPSSQLHPATGWAGAAAPVATLFKSSAVAFFSEILLLSAAMRSAADGPSSRRPMAVFLATRSAWSANDAAILVWLAVSRSSALRRGPLAWSSRRALDSSIGWSATPLPTAALAPPPSPPIAEACDMHRAPGVDPRPRILMAPAKAYPSSPPPCSGEGCRAPTGEMSSPTPTP